MTNPKRPLYSRLRSGKDYWEYVQRQEEIFNHIFDLVFAILPGDAISDILNVFTHAGSGHSYESLGRELFTRYGWGEHDNITTPDGFFIAKDSILAVELKFNAKTSLDQLAKYMMLIVSEEISFGQYPNVDLLYIFNTNPMPTFKKQTGFSPGEIGVNLFDDLVNSVSNKKVNIFLKEHENELKSTLDRINLNCICWQDLLDSLCNFIEPLEETHGDKTLERLITGLITEIRRHPLSNVKSSN